MKKLELTRKQLIENNKAVASFWLKNCPKTYRTNKAIKFVESFLTNPIQPNVTGEYALALYSGRRGNWTPYTYTAYPLWQVDAEAFRRREEQVHARRKAAKLCTTYADAGCFRIIVDGAEVLYPTPEGDGCWKVFFQKASALDAADLSLSLNGERDKLLGAFSAMQIKVCFYDCGDDIEGVEINTEKEKSFFQVYAVTNGIKILQII